MKLYVGMKFIVNNRRENNHLTVGKTYTVTKIIGSNVEFDCDIASGHVSSDLEFTRGDYIALSRKLNKQIRTL